MSFLIFESIFSSRIYHKSLKSQVIYEQYFNYTLWPPLLAVLVKEMLAIKCSEYFVYWEKICQNRHQRTKVKIYICSDTLNGKSFQKIFVTL